MSEPVRLRETRMIKALTGVISMLMAAMSVVAQPATTVDPAEGTSSTPGVLALPRLGSVGFRCSRSWAVQPLVDLAQAVATEESRFVPGR